MRRMRANTWPWRQQIPLLTMIRVLPDAEICCWSHNEHARFPKITSCQSFIIIIILVTLPLSVLALIGDVFETKQEAASALPKS